MSGETADRAITRALGDEIRRARDGQGLTRAELVERMPADISIQTLANYEYGIRQCTVSRLVEICQALGVSATSLLGLALQRARIDLYTNDFQVDLHAVARNEETDLDLLRTWARNRLALEPEGSGVARLERTLVEQWAIMLGMSWSEFVRCLLAFTPGAAPQW
ncbi:helix-turn-helix domain-containing protein [Actinocrispum wychmicini]|uniref:Transcriptional regulator with XRE-family HTH domain n=1 Tax=Actinocrispum wychmicini TaxID=1213861 RepID=A0A4R2JYL3_9PSEU|nr:helix-turn-helix transcriptional regulator [Actinocrispum wychmicini]TCO62496.1 transcriptional regulator with XRE-family HTH domain [Actinocrispum wychmicini]